ncbi:MAG: BlaI/MecI/CopY family transcriptional regulator [Bacteroidales bacterium]|jgi:predicted transcriptional regulator|nr:BlaI/MecI/CopY family transcriptional regulator [Bacteroidales bacterium]
MEIRNLTRAEEDVMQILWRLKKAFIKEILEKFDEPRPAYSTISTIIRILQDKGFVNYRVYGRTYQYFPVISKDDYRKAQMSNFVRDYFSNSYQKMVSFFAREDSITIKEMEDIMEMMKKSGISNTYGDDRSS